MSVLPNGWTSKRLSSVVKPRKQKAAPSSLGSTPFVGLEHVEAHSARILGYGCTSEMKSAVAVFEAGDVLYGRLRPYLNKVVRPEFPGAASAEFIVFPGNEQIDAAFLHRLLMQPAFLEFASHINQGDRPRVDFVQIGEFPLGLPPISEQRRIVAKLERLLKRSKSAREELSRIPRLVERYKQAILELAFSGILTAKWREQSTDRHTGEGLLKDIRANRMARTTTTKDRAQIERAFENGNLIPREDELGAGVDLPDSWTSCRIGAIGAVCNGSTPSRGQAKYWAGSIPWVSSGEVRNNVIVKTRELITRTGYENSSVKLLPKGTVLLAMIGEGKTRGQSAILDIEATINQNIAAVVIDHGMVLPEFLWRWFQLQYQQTRRRGAGNGPKALNCQAVRDLPFVLPPFAEQREVVCKINTSLSVIETFEVEASRALSLLDRLDQATLNKAFGGELMTEIESLKSGSLPD